MHVGILVPVPQRGPVQGPPQGLVRRDDVPDALAHAPQPLHVAPQLVRALRELRVTHA